MLIIIILLSTVQLGAFLKKSVQCCCRVRTNELRLRFAQRLCGDNRMHSCYLFNNDSTPRNIRHLKQDDAFNRTWWSVLSIDKLVTWQHLSMARIGGHVLLKASSCLRCLMLKLLRHIFSALHLFISRYCLFYNCFKVF